MRAAVAAAALLLLAGCVESDPSVVDVAPSDSSSTTVAAPPVEPPTAGALPRRPRPPAQTGSAAAPAVPLTPTVPGEASPPAPPASPSAVTGGPGAAAGHLLRPDGATSIVLQVLSHEGAEPRQATLDRLVEELQAASGKVVRAVGGAAPPDRQVWSSEDLVAAADAARFPTADGSYAIRMLFVHGGSESGEGVLGVSVTADVAAVFSDPVEEAARGLTSAASVERAVAVHELGHLLGLVDLAIDTGRDDPEHPGHSTNPQSVMYWAVESSLLGDLFGGGPPQRFDDQDRADLAAIRGG